MCCVIIKKLGAGKRTFSAVCKVTKYIFDCKEKTAKNNFENNWAFSCVIGKNVVPLHSLSEGSFMVDVAQLVRASDCGSEGRGFESHLPPQ